MQPDSGRMVHAGSAFSHPIRFLSSKEGQDHIVQNRPGSDLDGLVRFGPNASGPEASRGARIIRPGFWQNPTGQLPVSHFQTPLPSSTDGPDHFVHNRPGSILVLNHCVRFWPNGSGPERSVCTRVIEPASGQRFRADPDLIRHVDLGGGRRISGK